MVTPGVRCDQSRSGQAKRPRRSHGSFPPKMMSARIPFDREISAILQALGGTVHSLSPRADRFNDRRSLYRTAFQRQLFDSSPWR
jgi:hypothetical protein